MSRSVLDRALAKPTDRRADGVKAVSRRRRGRAAPALSPADHGSTSTQLLPGDRACLPPSSADTRQLDTSVGASGPHDFAVRLTRRSSAALSASTASRPAAVTIACRPSVGRNGGGYRSDLGKERTGIFLREGLDTGVAEQPVGQIREGTELALSSYTPVSPVFCRKEAGSLRVQMGCTHHF